MRSGARNAARAPEHDLSPREALWGVKRSLREEGAPLAGWSGWVLTGGE